jgi:hypothetical protein
MTLSTKARPIADGAIIIYSGRQYVGSVRRMPNGFLALDHDGRRLGVYGALRLASDAILNNAAAEVPR